VCRVSSSCISSITEESMRNVGLFSSIKNIRIDDNSGCLFNKALQMPIPQIHTHE
jgi:hypothetical protein